MTQATQAATPVDYQKGLLVADPLFSILSVPGHDDIVTLLTVIGYQAAAIAPEKEDQP